MATIHKDVVREAELREQRQAAAERRPEQKPFVGLALHDVAHADEPAMNGEPFELRACVGRLQVDPAHDAGNEGMRVGERQEPARLLDRLPRLHGNARVESGASHLTLRLRRQRVAPQRCQALVYPAVLGRVVLPEMLVRVDAHGRGAGHGSRNTGSITAHQSPGGASDEGSCSDRISRSHSWTRGLEAACIAKTCRKSRPSFNSRIMTSRRPSSMMSMRLTPARRRLSTTSGHTRLWWSR